MAEPIHPREEFAGSVAIHYPMLDLEVGLQAILFEILNKLYLYIFSILIIFKIKIIMRIIKLSGVT